MSRERDNIDEEPTRDGRWKLREGADGVRAERVSKTRRAAEPAAPVAGTTRAVDVERRAGDDRRVVSERVEVERRLAVRRAADRAVVARRRNIIGRITQGVDYAFYLLYGLLGIRFVLALLGASETAGFVQFINALTNPFYAPFAGIVARPLVNGGVLDFPLIIALLAYLLLHVAVRGLLRLVAGERKAP